MDFENELRKVAKQYQDDGYDVTVRPRGDAVPPFAAGYELDMIARRGAEHVVVEVKTHRTDLEKDTALVRLAELANSQPGWRFDLVVLEPETLLDRLRHEAREPTRDQIEERLNQAGQMAGAGYSQAAVMTAWAGLEAAMRRLTRAAGRNGDITPGHLLGTMYANGFVSKDEFVKLREAFAVRNRVAHGFVSEAVDPALVPSVIAAARKLLTAEETSGQPVAV
jgi:hypothetical protein